MQWISGWCWDYWSDRRIALASTTHAEEGDVSRGGKYVRVDELPRRKWDGCRRWTVGPVPMVTNVDFDEGVACSGISLDDPMTYDEAVAAAGAIGKCVSEVIRDMSRHGCVGRFVKMRKPRGAIFTSMRVLIPGRYASWEDLYRACKALEVDPDEPVRKRDMQVTASRVGDWIAAWCTAD